MATTYRYTTWVKGTSNFPLDMLRYDCAWPASQEDVTKIATSIDARVMAAYAEREGSVRSFVIGIVSNRPPTAGRWRSFGWEVVETRKEKWS